MTRLQRAKKFFRSNAATVLVLPLVFIASKAWAVSAVPQLNVTSQTLSFNPGSGGWAFQQPGKCGSSCGFNGLSSFRDGSTFNDGIQGISLFGDIAVFCTVDSCAGDSFTLDLQGNVTGLPDGETSSSGFLNFEFYSNSNTFAYTIGDQSGNYDGDNNVTGTANFPITNGTWDVQLTITPDGNASFFDLTIPGQQKVPSTLDISATADEVTTPEPGSLLLMFTGASVLFGLRKRRA